MIYKPALRIEFILRGGDVHVRCVDGNEVERHADGNETGRAVPSGLIDAPNSAQDLPLAGGSGERDNHSSAFFNTPGIEKLYSGIAKISASAAAILLRKLYTAPGIPCCSMSLL